MSNYISLFDYLGKPAGPDLGKQVAAEAKIKGVQITTRSVITKKYTGNVLLYPENFLKEYFEKTNA